MGGGGGGGWLFFFYLPLCRFHECAGIDGNVVALIDSCPFDPFPSLPLDVYFLVLLVSVPSKNSVLERLRFERTQNVHFGDIFCI